MKKNNINYINEWQKRNPEKVKQYRKKYRENHKEKLHLQSKIWRKKNPDKCKEYCSNYYNNNKKKENNRCKLWQKKNHEKVLNGSNRRRFGGNRFKVLERDNYCCRYCGMTQEMHFICFGKRLYVHHIDENKHNNKMLNLITLCIRCHRIVHNSKIINWKLSKNNENKY